MRLTFNIDTETHKVLIQYIPHGLQNCAYRALIEGLAIELKKNPGAILRELLSYHIDNAELIKTAREGKQLG